MITCVKCKEQTQEFYFADNDAVCSDCVKVARSKK